MCAGSATVATHITRRSPSTVEGSQTRASDSTANRVGGVTRRWNASLWSSTIPTSSTQYFIPTVIASDSHLATADEVRKAILDEDQRKLVEQVMSSPQWRMSEIVQRNADLEKDVKRRRL